MPAVAVPSIDVQVQLSGSTGAWTSLQADLLSTTNAVARYGIQSNHPTEHIAPVGSLTFGLNNAQDNSGKKLGYYSPGNANARAGFDLGIGVRMAVTYSGSTFYKFMGRIDEIQPVAGQYRGRQVIVTAVDWFDEAQIAKLRAIPTATASTVDQLITTLVAQVPRQPPSTCYFVGQQEFPFALDTSQDENDSVYNQMRKAADSDLGYLYTQGDQTAGGKLVYHDRRYRLNSTCAVSSASLSNAMVEMRPTRRRSNVYNTVRVTVHPRRVDPSACAVMYSLNTNSPPTIPGGTTTYLTGQFRDPQQQAIRVGITSPCTPVSGTDYAMGVSASDTSLTACLTPTACVGGNSVYWTLQNTGVNNGLISLLQLRGQGLYDYAPIQVSASDATSTGSYGAHTLTIDMPHETTANTASAIADWYLRYYKNPNYFVDSVTFVANDTDAQMKAALVREPGDVITLTEQVTGLSSSDYFINGVELTAYSDSLINCKWVVVPRLDTTDYFILENNGTTPGFSASRGQLNGLFGLAPM